MYENTDCSSDKAMCSPKHALFSWDIPEHVFSSSPRWINGRNALLVQTFRYSCPAGGPSQTDSGLGGLFCWFRIASMTNHHNLVASSGMNLLSYSLKAQRPEWVCRPKIKLLAELCSFRGISGIIYSLAFSSF